jgi:hypothetical protein
LHVCTLALSERFAIQFTEVGSLPPSRFPATSPVVEALRLRPRVHTSALGRRAMFCCISRTLQLSSQRPAWFDVTYELFSPKETTTLGLVSLTAQAGDCIPLVSGGNRHCSCSCRAWMCDLLILWCWGAAQQVARWCTRFSPSTRRACASAAPHRSQPMRVDLGGPSTNWEENS